MKKSSRPVITPAVNPAAFDLDWRYKLATICKSNIELPLAAMQDVDLVDYMVHRMARASGMAKITHYDHAETWRGTELGYAIEAALLTAASEEEIAQLLGLESEPVRMYRALFFDVRDQAGAAIPGVLIRMRFQTDEGQPESQRLLVKAAITGGISLLRSVLGVDPIPYKRDQNDVDFAFDLAHRELVRRTLAGEMSNGDLSRIIATGVIRDRHMEESGSRGPKATERVLFEAFMQVLKLSAPVLYDQVLTPDQKLEMDAQLAAKLYSQRDARNDPTFSALDDGRSKEWFKEVWPEKVAQLPSPASGGGGS